MLHMYSHDKGRTWNMPMGWLTRTGNDLLEISQENFEIYMKIFFNISKIEINVW